MQRWIQVGGVTILALLLGWQFGVQSEQRRLMEDGWQEVPGSEQVLIGSGSIAQDPEREADIRLLWRTWHLLIEHYIDPEQLQTEKMVQGAVGGLVRAVGDPYTVFMTPSENEDFRSTLSGTLEGIGAELAERDGGIAVVAPIKGSPAQKAGLMPDDYILSVDGVTTEGLTLNETVTRIRGPRGTTVKLEIARAKQPAPMTLSIVREQIHIPSVESKIISSDGKQVGYVSLNQFGDGSIVELRKELEIFEDKNVASIILDLRYNGGGYLDGAVDLVSLFLKEGKVVEVKHREGPLETHEVSGRPLFPSIPLVVLVNEGTASASEITAGALQDYARATIIGKKTFGKGTVQEVIDLPGGSSLRVTVAKWLTPKGKDLSKEGVHPDIEIERTPEDLKAERDPQLDGAVEFLKTGKRPVQGSSSSVSSQ